MIYDNFLKITIFNFLILNLLIYLTTKFSLKYNLVDLPNFRSLHKKKIPNLGGLPIILIFYINIIFFTNNFTNGELFFLTSLLIISLVGLVDDIYGLSSILRFTFQIFISLIAIYGLYNEDITLFDKINNSYFYLFCFVIIIFIVWLINIFNFMDGINGLVSIKSILFISGILFLIYNSNVNIPQSYNNLFSLCLVINTLILFFIPWNFPSAKIFMGDSLSYFLGFYISFMIVILSLISIDFLWASLILLSLFLIDTSYTLTYRLIKKTNIFKAHKSHAYQILTEYFQSHIFVTVLQAAIFLLFLFPISYLIVNGILNGFFTTLVVYTFLIFIIFLIKKIKLN